MEVESADMDSDMRNDNENEEEEEPRDPLADDEPAVKIEGGKNGNDEKTAKSDVSRRTRRKNASSHFLDASASENEDPGSDSDQEYKPPESKSKMKPKTQGVKRRKSETKSQVCVKPIKKLVKNNENDSLNFAPIKITSVTSLSAETKTPPKSMKPKPNFKRNTVECQVAVKYAIDNANKLAEDIRSECSKIKEAPKDTKDIIASAKELFGVLNRTKSRIEHVENTFKADIHKIFAQNNCSWYLENDSDFGVPNSSNGKSQESDSDCEIVDSATASTSFDNVPTDSSNIYHVLKKIEKQGISWKNSKTLTTSDRVLNAMANSQKPVMIGKDIVVKKIPALPKNQPMNSFFWLDGRTLKPPDSSNVTAFVMVLQDITEYIKQMMDLRPLDLNKSDIPNIVNCIDRVYVCEYVEEIVLDDADAENASDILYDDFCHAYSKLPSSETCEYTIVKKSILNASESDKLCIVSSEKCAESSRPKSLFLMCLNSMFSIYEKIVCCDSFIYNEFKTNVAIYKKHFEKIVNLRNYYTMAHFEEHLKKNLINKNILNFFEILVKKGSMEFDFSDDDTYIDQLSGLSMSETSIDSDYEDYGDAHQNQNTPKKSWAHDILINQILDDSSDSESVLSQSVLKEMSQNISPEDLSNVDKIKLDVTSKGTSVKKRKPDELLNEVDRLLHNDEENERSSDEKPPSKKKCTSINSNPNDIIILSDDNSNMSGIFLIDDNDVDESDNDECMVYSQNKFKHLKKKRKNTRKIMDHESLKDSTKQAVKNEVDRINKLNIKQEERDGYFQNFVMNRQKFKEFTLDCNDETREKVYIHPCITKELHHHQLEGVKFMWDSCFDSIESLKQGSAGSGCILAHCMGLGKTLQVIALTHSLLTSSISSVHTVLICCPLTTVLNWVDEYNKWLFSYELRKDVRIYELSQIQNNQMRFAVLEDWQAKGGVLIIGYTMFRNLANLKSKISLLDDKFVKKMQDMLLDPGPDLVICDEGHLLKNEKTSLATTMNKIRTKRRIVLTGTPLQNNLKEYYCMVNFIKPHLLGTPREYMNRFINPITNGQHRDSTSKDIKIMKKRSHVLHKMLEGCVQRKEASILYEYLPHKQEYVLFTTLSHLQAKLYRSYLDSINNTNDRKLLKNYHAFRKIWTHPKLVVNTLLNEPDVDVDNLYVSHKFTVIFSIISECKEFEEKLLVFCCSLKTLDIIEYFLDKIYNWKKNHEYYRLDGSLTGVARKNMCDNFNSISNTKVKLMLISTRAGGEGINLTGANRAIVMDVSWNPAQDMQSIFRIYRFGQLKNCYIYRIIAQGTMEEKIYERSVTKEAVSCRVVDEQQIDRHYSMTELDELYSFEHVPNVPQTSLMLPEDNLLTQVLYNLKKLSKDTIPIVWSMHDHDSLLRDNDEEQLDDSERREAWIEYEAEKLALNYTHQDKNHVQPVSMPNKDGLTAEIDLPPTSEGNLPIPIINQSFNTYRNITHSVENTHHKSKKDNMINSHNSIDYITSTSKENTRKKTDKNKHNYPSTSTENVSIPGVIQSFNALRNVAHNIENTQKKTVMSKHNYPSTSTGNVSIPRVSQYLNAYQNMAYNIENIHNKSKKDNMINSHNSIDYITSASKENTQKKTDMSKHDYPSTSTENVSIPGVIQSFNALRNVVHNIENTQKKTDMGKHNYPSSSTENVSIPRVNQNVNMYQVIEQSVEKFYKSNEDDTINSSNSVGFVASTSKGNTKKKTCVDTHNYPSTSTGSSSFCVENSKRKLNFGNVEISVNTPPPIVIDSQDSQVINLD